MDIFQIIAVAVVGMLLAVMLKGYRPEIAVGISIMTGIVLLIISVSGINEVFNRFEYMVEKSGIDVKYFTVVVKVIAIAYITQFASEICKDGGHNGIAMKLETAGKIFVMILTMPIVSGFLELVISILN